MSNTYAPKPFVLSIRVLIKSANSRPPSIVILTTENSSECFERTPKRSFSKADLMVADPLNEFLDRPDEVIISPSSSPKEWT